LRGENIKGKHNPWLRDNYSAQAWGTEYLWKRKKGELVKKTFENLFIARPPKTLEDFCIQEKGHAKRCRRTTTPKGGKKKKKKKFFRGDDFLL